MIPIDDPEDPRIEAFRDVRERDLVGRRGLFIAEGEVVLSRLLEAPRFQTLAVLLAENRADRLAPVVAARRPDVPVYVAGREVLDRLVGFPLHRGVLALGRRAAGPPADALLGSLAGPVLGLGLFGLSNHDNVGGAFRNAAAFAADAVLLDGGCADPLYRKALRVSVGAVLKTPFVHGGDAAALLAAVRAAGVEPVAFSPAGEVPLRTWRPPSRCVLVFGAEGPGLPEAVLSSCPTVRIEMPGGFDSLNVATSVGVALHWARTSRA